MKIGILSDLHIDTNAEALGDNESFSGLLSQVLKENEIDLLLLAGDISNHYRLTQNFIEHVQEKSDVPILFVPGNHDYWAKDHDVYDTNQLHDYYKNKKESLIGKPKIINEEWAIIGSPGWYDYGYGNNKVFSYEYFSKKKYKIAYWNDYHYIDWGKPDDEVSEDMYNQLLKDIEKVGERKVILMTHVATHPNFVVPLPHRLYDFVNAFLGAKGYEELYREYPQIEYSIMGHVHFRKRVDEFGISFLSACLGSRKHWFNKNNVKREMEETLMTIDI